MEHCLVAVDPDHEIPPFNENIQVLTKHLAPFFWPARVARVSIENGVDRIEERFNQFDEKFFFRIDMVSKCGFAHTKPRHDIGNGGSLVALHHKRFEGGLEHLVSATGLWHPDILLNDRSLILPLFRNSTCRRTAGEATVISRISAQDGSEINKVTVPITFAEQKG